MSGAAKWKIAACLACGIAVLVAFVVLDQRYRFLGRTVFRVREWWHAHEWKNRSLWLPDYEVAVDAKVIDGIDGNLSGLTWNDDTKTLFAVTNHPPRIVELSTSGELSRLIPLVDFDDPEAIEYIGESEFIVAEERTQKIIGVVITPETTEIRAAGLQRLSLGEETRDNKGLEGLAWDSVNRKLYAAKERNPVHIFEVTGFPHDPSTTLDIEVKSDKNRDARLFLKDVSSLDFNKRHQHLLVLSHESRLVIEIDKSGEPISVLSLNAGDGLQESVPQAEGIAMDDEDNLYVVSEPNLFYVFMKKRAGAF
jgi:uncharacterized protein YjiK